MNNIEKIYRLCDKIEKEKKRNIYFVYGLLLMEE